MNACFADTFFYLALLNREDEAHDRARSLNRELTDPLVTTAWVLMEVADALSAPANRDLFLELLSALRADPQVTVVPPSATLFDRGVDLFRARADKGWSLTDCISFVVIEDYGIVEVLTADHHFEQAGYRILL